MITRTVVVIGSAVGLLTLRPAPVVAVPVEGTGTTPVSPAKPSAADTKADEGFQALRRGDNDAAEAAFREAARLDPKRPRPYLGLAEVAGRKNKPELVESFLKQALAADPNDSNAARVWAAHLFRRGRFADAEAAFKKLIALDPSSPEARADLGETYLLGLKKPKAAEDAYRGSLARDPRYLRAQLGLAGSLAAQRRTDEAVAAYRQAASFAPTDPRPMHSLGRLYASQAKFDLALAENAKAIAVDPAYLPALVDRGDLFLAKNDVEGAIAAYKAGVTAVKEPALLYFRLGVAYQGAQRWPEAMQAYLDAVKHEPAMFGAYNNLAFIAASRKERLDDALGWAKKAIELSPKETTLYDTLGWVHRARGELELAAKAIETAVAANPKQPSFRYHLGVVYAEQGKTKEAATELQRALELDKNFRYAADARTRLQALRGK